MEAVVSAHTLGSLGQNQQHGPIPPGDALAWHTLPWAAQSYVGAVMIGGLVVLVAFFPTTYPQPLLFAALTLFSCLTSTWKVTLPIPIASGSTLSVSYAANLMAMLMLGTRHAVLIAAAGVWTQCTYKARRPYPLYRTLFSIAAEVLTMAATGAAFAQLGGNAAPPQFAGIARPLVGAIATYFMLNTALVAVAIALSSGRSIVAVWVNDFMWSGASFMVAGSAGAMAALVVARDEAWKAALLMAPIYLTYRTYEMFVGRLEDQRRHVAEMRQMHQGTVEALMQARQAEHAEQAARAAAERANRLKDEFLAVVSHELRTPLNSILGWSDILLRSAADYPRRDRAVQAIYDSARRQATLIDDLLDVSRVTSGTLRLERTAVDLKDVVHDAMQVIQPAADAKDIHVAIDTKAWVGFVQGDAARLQQVVSNLMSNAVKFTPAGGCVRLTLSRSGGAAQIEIADTGQGIAPDFLPCVFEAFRQGDASTTRSHGGLGLGLSIVKHLVDAHGGTVAAESAGPGHGATFMVRIPLAPECLAYPISHRSSVDADHDVSLSGLRVLVVDDDEESRLVVAEHLSNHEAVPITAGSASAAYEILRSSRIDVVLADIAMPGEDGYAMMRRLRAGFVPDATVLPAAALTALARQGDRELALDAGFQIHLTKPISPRTLVAAVATLAQMGTSRGARAPTIPRRLPAVASDPPAAGE
jgi:signal transduction histidine kinase